MMMKYLSTFKRLPDVRNAFESHLWTFGYPTDYENAYDEIRTVLAWCNEHFQTGRWNFQFDDSFKSPLHAAVKGWRYVMGDLIIYFIDEKDALYFQLAYA